MLETTHDADIVLIIDDDQDIRDTLAEILRDEGYNVHVCSNGKEALTYLHQAKTRPSLILSDLMMPVMTGWEFRTEQQKDHDLDQIPTVALSAARNYFNSSVSFTDYLPKPIRLDRLLDIIERHCKKADSP